MEVNIPLLNLLLYFLKEGIKHELTMPHTPQQNGTTERLNRTLTEGVRTMLADSSYLSVLG